MSGSTNVLFVVYIRTNHLIKSRFIFQSFANTSKINHMEKVIEDLNVFGKCFKVRQKVGDEIQILISYIKNELQTSVETKRYC